MTYQTLVSVVSVVSVVRGFYTFLYEDEREGSVFTNIVDTSVLSRPEKCGTVIIRPFAD